MNTKELKEYLSIVVDMEKNIYMQNSIITELEKEIDSLGLKKQFYKPDKPKSSPKDYTYEWIFTLFMLLFGLGMIGLGILIFLWGKKFFTGELGFFKNSGVRGPGVTLINYFSGFILFIMGLSSTISGFILICHIPEEIESSEKAKEKAKREELEYEKANNKYKKDRLIDQKRIKRELVRKKILTANLQQIKYQNSESKHTLEKIYAQNIIFPKYRNLIMVCSLYEYFCSERCYSLGGSDGAYNLLENEIRLEQIIIRLDNIIEKLDAIQNNQFLLYSAIKKSNQQSAQILEATHNMADNLEDLSKNFSNRSAELNEEIANLQKTSALTAYHEERIQKELSYMNRMNYFTSMNNSTYNSFPPT